MKPKLVQYEGKTVMQVPIEWQGSHLFAIMDGVKLVALRSPHEPLLSGYNFLWDFRDSEKEIAHFALTEAVKLGKGTASQYSGTQPKSVEFEGRTVLQVEVEYHGTHFVALVDGTQLVALGYSLEDCYQYGCLSYVSKRNREEITELALKKLVACLASQVDADAKIR